MSDYELHPLAYLTISYSPNGRIYAKLIDSNTNETFISATLQYVLKASMERKIKITNIQDIMFMLTEDGYI